MIWLLVAAGLVMAGDATYDAVIHARHDRWEKTIERDATGLREGYADFTAGTGRVALLMVHGFGAGPLTWGRMAPELAGHGFTCRAMRLPGFGRPIDEYAQATRQQWLDAIHGEVLRLRADHDAVWLAGHSMGGTLCLLEALEHPGDVDGLILLAPLVEVNGQRSPLLSPRAWFEITDRLAVFTDLTEMAFDVDINDPEVRARVVRDQFVPRSIYRQLFALTDSVKGRASGLRVPVFLAYADADLVADPLAARRYIEAAVNAPRSEIMEQRNAGHVVTWDRGWEDTCEEIRTFIDHP